MNTPSTGTPRTFARTVGTSLIRLEATQGNRATKGFLVEVLETNAGTVYLGGADVTTSNGKPLKVVNGAPAMVFIEHANPFDWYVIADQAGQELRITVV